MRDPSGSPGFRGASWPTRVNRATRTGLEQATKAPRHLDCGGHCRRRAAETTRSPAVDALAMWLGPACTSNLGIVTRRIRCRAAAGVQPGQETARHRSARAVSAGRQPRSTFPRVRSWTRRRRPASTAAPMCRRGIAPGFPSIRARRWSTSRAHWDLPHGRSALAAAREGRRQRPGGRQSADFAPSL